MIIPFFPPMAGGGVYRPLSFVRELSRHGWQPTVVAPRGDTFWITDPALVERLPDDCRVIRTTAASGQWLLARAGRAGGGARSQRRSSRVFSVMRRAASTVLVPDTYVGWLPYALRAARRVLEETSFAAIYSTSPPETSHLVASRLHGDTGLPWVADFRDPWMNLYLFPPPTPIHRLLHRRFERRVCERAHVVVTTEWHERQLQSAYPRMTSLTRIPNGYDGEAIESVRELGPSGDRMKIVHAGMLTQNRSAIPFLRGLARFIERRPAAAGRIDVTFVGAREDRNDRAAAELVPAGMVSFRDTVPQPAVLELEKTAHVLLLIKHVNPDYAGMVPGKLYEYIGLCRPILALAPDGEASDLVRSLERGEVCNQEDPESVAAGIETLYERFENGRLDDSYDLSPQPGYERAAGAKRLADLLDAAAQEGR